MAAGCWLLGAGCWLMIAGWLMLVVVCLPGTACDCSRLSATACECLRLSVTACDCLRLPRILGGWPDFAHLESENMVPYWVPELGHEIGGQLKMISFPL